MHGICTPFYNFLTLCAFRQNCRKKLVFVYCFCRCLCLVLSCLVLSCLVLPCLLFACVVLSCLVFVRRLLRAKVKSSVLSLYSFRGFVCLCLRAYLFHFMCLGVCLRIPSNKIGIVSLFCWNASLPSFLFPFLQVLSLCVDLYLRLYCVCLFCTSLKFRLCFVCFHGSLS